MLHANLFASAFTHATLAATATIATAGATLNVYGFVISNTDGTARTFTFADNDGVSIAIIRVLANSTIVSDIQFLAANGLTVAADGADAAATVTVFHSHRLGGA